jgi:CRP-like cAMP-binding protein
VGELSLVDGGPRSATVTAVTPRVALARASRAALDALCENDKAIGYRVMRNIAADVAYKLRFRDLRG